MSFTHKGEHYRRSTETGYKKLATRIFDKLKGEIAEGRHYGLNVERIVFEDLKTDLEYDPHIAAEKITKANQDKQVLIHQAKNLSQFYHN